jgi:PAS domain S-box-containing protein
MHASGASPTRTLHMDSDPTSDSTRLLQAHQRAGIRALLITLMVCAPLVTAAIFLREGLTPLWWISAALTLSVAAACWLFLKGHENRAAQALLAVMLLGSVLAIVVQGTVQSAAVLVLFAVLVCAGAMLSARALVVTTTACIMALALLNLAEQMHWLRKGNLEVGVAVWITQSAALVTVLISVYFGRQRLTGAIRDQEQALLRARETEVRLRQSEGRFAALFRNNPAATVVQHIETQAVLEVNEAFVRMFGLSRADPTLFNPNQLWHHAHERRQFQALMSEHNRVVAFQAIAQHQEGHTFEAQVFGELVTQDTETLLILMVLDVSEEKRREAQLIDLATGVSGDTGLPFFQSLVRHMSKALGADLVLVGEFQAPDTVQTLAAYFDDKPVPNVEYRIAGTPCEHAAAHMGDCFFAERLAEQYPMDAFPIGGGYSTYMGVALQDTQGSLIGILKAMWIQPKTSSSELQALMSIFSSRCNAELNRLRRDRDIQRLSDTLEQRVTERTAQLEYLNRELDSFSYTVSHDLKSPLRSINGFMQMLGEQMVDRIRPEDQVVIDRIQGAVDRMSQLIQDLLALARVSQNTLKRQWVDLSQVALDVLKVEQQRDPGRVVEIRVAPGLRTFCDPHLSRIVLENLLGNAWKYSRNTACPCIEFFQAQKTDGSDPVFCVRDNGAGFDMSRAERLFKPFNRLHSAREFEGSGVGLATVRRIIERHGGHIKGEGAVGQGSCFQFSFGHSVD